jgi:hypothetical protein
LTLTSWLLRVRAAAAADTQAVVVQVVIELQLDCL